MQCTVHSDTSKVRQEKHISMERARTHTHICMPPLKGFVSLEKWTRFVVHVQLQCTAHGRSFIKPFECNHCSWICALLKLLDRRLLDRWNGARLVCAVDVIHLIIHLNEGASSLKIHITPRFVIGYKPLCFG